MLTPEVLRRLPKAELHVHLDGSLRPATMIDLAKRARVSLPASTPDALARHMLVDDARNLDDYLARFELTIALLQTPEAIERAAWEMCEDAAADGVRYLEVRYCPQLSRRSGLSLDEVVSAELTGLARGEADFGIVTRAINCSLRHFDPAVSEEIAAHSATFRGRGVVGFDLAGGEAMHRASPHARAFDLAARGGLRVTVHAGEAAGADSVAEAVHACRAERIGHGTRLYENPALRDYIRDRRILLETNITSNVQTHAVPSASAHPVRRYYDEGLNVTLSTDNWLMSGVTLSGEYWLAHTELRFTREEIDRMILNGFEGAFLSWPERQALAASVRDELADLR
ncbi:MAG TPA: adenosine deaminase [Gemmatimonadales bacterium]|nr:adenosine deaminase [Gemmatimonadales bacterium]